MTPATQQGEKGMTPEELEELLMLAIENEQLEREWMAACLRREMDTELLKQLQNGLCRASNLARKAKGLPSLREESRGKGK